MDFSFRLLWVLVLLLAVRGSRWAYLAFVVLGLLYFPMEGGWHLQAPRCQIGFDIALALDSLMHYAHVALFAAFYVVSAAHFSAHRESFGPVTGPAFGATMVMGLAVELMQGISGEGNCRMRDLLPDAAGACIALGVWNAGRWVATRVGRRRRGR